MVRFLALLFIVFAAICLWHLHTIVKLDISHNSSEHIGPWFALLLLTLFVGGLAAFFVLLFSALRPLWVVNAMVLFASLWLSLVVAEYFIRYTNRFATYLEQRDGFYRSYFNIKPETRYLTWGNTKEHWFSCPEFRYWRPTNKHGLGEYDFDSLSRLPGIKIMAMGDSFTEGDGAPYDSSWIKQLGAMLNYQRLKTNPIVTLNAGICANDPVYSVMQFKEELVQYKPDIAILCINENDIHDVKARGGLERFKPDGSLVVPQNPWWEPFYAESHLLRFYLHYILGYDHNFITYDEFEKSKSIYADKLKDVFSLFAKTCAENKIRPVIVMIPIRDELRQKQYLDYLDSVRVRITALPSVTLVDVLKYELSLPVGEADAQKIYWKEDNHMNSEGYKIMARAIKNQIDTFSELKQIEQDNLAY